MRGKILVQIPTDDGASLGAEEIESLGKSLERAEDLGPSFAKRKVLLPAARIDDQQVHPSETKGLTKWKQLMGFEPAADAKRRLE